MRSLMKYLLILGLLPAFLLTSCKKDSTTPEVDEFSVLANYIDQNGLDMDAMQAGKNGASKWVTSAGGLNVNQSDYSVPDYYIIDLRSANDFEWQKQARFQWKPDQNDLITGDGSMV